MKTANMLSPPILHLSAFLHSPKHVIATEPMSPHAHLSQASSGLFFVTSGCAALEPAEWTRLLQCAVHRTRTSQW